MEQHVVEIWIWGIKFTSMPMTLQQCDEAQNTVMKEYPGMNVMVKEAVAK